MTFLAAVLLTLSIGDYVAGGLASEPSSRARVWAGIVSAGVVSGLGSMIFFDDHAERLVLTLVATVGTVVWLIAKGNRTSGTAWTRPRLALGTLAVTVGGAAVLAATFYSASPAFIDQWLRFAPFPAVWTLRPESFLLLLSLGLFLGSPANGVVKAVLTSAGTRWRESEQTLRGGRLIGILERWLIFALAIAGDPTAAALVVSAKSLLRFPEISRSARAEEDARAAAGPRQIDIVTEYFLLGSLTSWALAIAPALLMRTPP